MLQKEIFNMQEIGEVEMADDDVEEEVDYNLQTQDKSEKFERFISKLNEASGMDEANEESKGIS